MSGGSGARGGGQALHSRALHRLLCARELSDAEGSALICLLFPVGLAMQVLACFNAEFNLEQGEAGNIWEPLHYLLYGTGVQNFEWSVEYAIRTPLFVFPLVLLVSLTWCVFWMDEESVSNRVNISFIGILTVVAYTFIVGDHVPQIAYATLLDAFLSISFLVMSLSLVINIVVDKHNRAGRKELGDRIDRVSRWAFPLGYLLANVITTIVFFTLW